MSERSIQEGRAVWEADFRAYIDACSRHDWETVRTFFADEIVVNGTLRTGDGLLEDLKALAAQDPDTRWSIVTCHCTPDSVAATLISEGAERYGTEIAHYWTEGRIITRLRIIV